MKLYYFLFGNEEVSCILYTTRILTIHHNIYYMKLCLMNSYIVLDVMKSFLKWKCASIIITNIWFIRHLVAFVLFLMINEMDSFFSWWIFISFIVDSFKSFFLLVKGKYFHYKIETFLNGRFGLTLFPQCNLWHLSKKYKIICWQG